MRRKSVYIETSVASYLTARPSSDLWAAACQKITRDWWTFRRSGFDLFVSALVIEEAGRGDTRAAAKRLKCFETIPLLEMAPEVVMLADALIEAAAVPIRAIGDALHISLSAVHGVDYLLTWNCRHIDNAENKPLIRRVCLDAGYVCPEICAPIQLMGG